jgi:hypothetical protein
MTAEPIVHAHEVNLAWALASAAKPYLTIRQRHVVFVTIGAGDTFAAIRMLMKSVAFREIPVRSELIRWCRSWLGTYAGHEEAHYLHDLVEELTVQSSLPDAALSTRREAPTSNVGPWSRSPVSPPHMAVRVELASSRA